VKRLIFCSGKIYYDLWGRRQEIQAFENGIIRIEQLYPFPAEALGAVLDGYRGARDLVWVQEEPENRGALRHIREQFLRYFPDRRLTFVSRPASASPAVGSHRQHVAQQREVVDRALGGAAGGAAQGAARAAGASVSPDASDKAGGGSAGPKRSAAKSGKRGKA
jgi:2-oxoglutarate dehydrogenase E1 component